MKKNEDAKENTAIRATYSTQSAIGLYEMLAQAQPSLSNEVGALADRVSLNSSSYVKSDE